MLGIFFFIQAGLQVFGGLIAVLMYGGMGIFAITSSRRGDDQVFGAIMLGIAVFAVFFVAIIAGIDAMAGWRLTKGKSGARTWGIVASIISLLGFPLGTALGIYGLWFLFGNEGRDLDLQASATPPPPPNSWQ